MKKFIFFPILFLSFLLLISLVKSGRDDKWIECGSADSSTSTPGTCNSYKVVKGQKYCCCEGPKWYKASDLAGGVCPVTPTTITIPPCTEDSDCPCPTDQCVGANYYNYPDYGKCVGGNCNVGTGSGEACEPKIISCFFSCFFCGDGKCDKNCGEDINSCPQDCKCTKDSDCGQICNQNCPSQCCQRTCDLATGLCKDCTPPSCPPPPGTCTNDWDCPPPIFTCLGSPCPNAFRGGLIGKRAYQGHYKCIGGVCSFVKDYDKVCRCDAEDSDGGQNFFVKGNCTDYLGCGAAFCCSDSYIDNCVSSKFLREYYIKDSGDAAYCTYVDKDCRDFGPDYICFNETATCVNAPREGCCRKISLTLTPNSYNKMYSGGYWGEEVYCPYLHINISKGERTEYSDLQASDDEYLQDGGGWTSVIKYCRVVATRFTFDISGIAKNPNYRITNIRMIWEGHYKREGGVLSYTNLEYYFNGDYVYWGTLSTSDKTYTFDTGPNYQPYLHDGKIEFGPIASIGTSGGHTELYLYSDYASVIVDFVMKDDTECFCPSDKCIDKFYYDYPDHGLCDISNCNCSVGTGSGEACEPKIDDCSDCSCSCGGYNTKESFINGNCNDGKDNDCDGKIDCKDPDCSESPACACGSLTCEYEKGENQINCPSDCKTEVKVYADLNGDGKITKSELVTPSSNLFPRQNVTVVVTFNDSRYNSTQGFNLKLDATIDEMPWGEENGCKMCGKSIDEMGCKARGDKKGWNSETYKTKIYMENGYAEIEFNATLPSYLTPGTHKIKITPVLLSFPITLRAVELQFKVGDGLYNFVLAVKNIFNSLTGFFVYH